MKDYASMSDFEINSAVHNALLDKPYELTFHGDGKITWKDKDSGRVIETGIVGYTKHGLHDYCNNPADAWPIITANRIGVIPGPEHVAWRAAHRVIGEDSNPRHFTQDANPLRAAMIVFLKMKEVEND